MASGLQNTDGENAPPPPLVIPASNWTLFRSLPTFDIRNGDASAVTSVHVKATISASYHWVPIGQLPAANAIMAVEVFVRSHLVHLTDNNPSNLSAAAIRKAAIILGTIRAVTTTFYRLEIADLIAGELRAPLINGVLDNNGRVEYTVATGYTGANSDMLTKALNLTDTEAAVICALLKCAPASRGDPNARLLANDD